MDPASGVQFPGEGSTARGEIPEAAKGLCWGGFLMNWIWGIGNNTYIAFLTVIPVVGLVMPFVLLFKGREWAWKNKQWRDVEHFNSIQRIWTIIGLVLIVGFFGLG